MSDQGESQAGTDGAEKTVIGIAIGNTNSSIAFMVDGKVDVIANEDGDRQIPTVLSYVNGEEYYGGQAKNFLVRNPINTIAYFKEFIGQEFKSIDPTHCHASAHPVEFGDTVSFSVKDKSPPAEGEDSESAEEAPPSSLSVTEITTRFLRRLVGSASEYIGRKVTSAVVAVPTNFSEKQREAFVAAARAADLEILQLVSDPAAVLLAYDARSGTALADRIIVVADLGGTRSDVSVVASRGGMYTVLATAHDYEFAGVHLDQALIDHFAREFLKKNSTAADPRSNPRSLAKLRLEAEATKKALSLGTNATFSVESLIDGIDYSATINRVRYEMVARNTFEGFGRLVQGVVKKAGLDVLDVDCVVLAGGTAHTPRIATNLASLFPESTAIVAPATSATATNPSELQVRGAALQASLIGQYDPEDIEQAVHAAVTTVTHTTNAIGVVVVTGGGNAGTKEEEGQEKDEQQEGFVSIIAPETAVPARRTIRIRVPSGGGDALVRVVEGGTHIKVTKPEPKPEKEKREGAEVDDDKEDDTDTLDSDDDAEDGDEVEEQREKIWKIGNVLAEGALRDTKDTRDSKKGGLVEVTVNVSADLGVSVSLRELGSRAGHRAVIPPPKGNS